MTSSASRRTGPRLPGGGAPRRAQPASRVAAPGILALCGLGLLAGTALAAPPAPPPLDTAPGAAAGAGAPDSPTAPNELKPRKLCLGERRAKEREDAAAVARLERRWEAIADASVRDVARGDDEFWARRRAERAAEVADRVARAADAAQPILDMRRQAMRDAERLERACGEVAARDRTSCGEADEPFQDALCRLGMDLLEADPGADRCALAPAAMKGLCEAVTAGGDVAAVSCQVEGVWSKACSLSRRALATPVAGCAASPQAASDCFEGAFSRQVWTGEGCGLLVGDGPAASELREWRAICEANAAGDPSLCPPDPLLAAPLPDPTLHHDAWLARAAGRPVVVISAWSALPRSCAVTVTVTDSGRPVASRTRPMHVGLYGTTTVMLDAPDKVDGHLFDSQIEVSAEFQCVPTVPWVSGNLNDAPG